MVGAATLGAEIAAARLMAPFFGASTIVWANTIGVVLVALSIGYWIGGRIADAHPHLRGLCLMVLAAAVLLARGALRRPAPLRRLGRRARSDLGRSLRRLAVRRAVLVAVPVVLLGAVSPYAIRLAVAATSSTRAAPPAGSTRSRPPARCSGTWLAALLLIPFAGTQRTFLIFAAAIALVAAAGLGRRYVAVPVAAGAGAWRSRSGTCAPPTTASVLIYETETEQQYVQVIEEADGDRGARAQRGAGDPLALPARQLSDRPLLGRADRAAVRAPTDRPPERVAILGNAAGTAARHVRPLLPARRGSTAVEIDGELTEIGRRYFDLGGPNLHTHTADARPWLRRSAGDFDVIVVDAYRQPYIPFYLATREFFELVAEMLAPGGVVVVNVGHPEGSDDLEQVVGRRWPRPSRPSSATRSSRPTRCSVPRRAVSASVSSGCQRRPAGGAAGDRAADSAGRIGPRLSGRRGLHATTARRSSG